MSNLTKPKDNQWLQIEVCQEFLIGNCSKITCNYAHPSSNVEISQGKVVTCFDSIRAKCKRGMCKFYHPTNHIIELMFSKTKQPGVSTSTITPTSNVQFVPLLNYHATNQLTPLSIPNILENTIETATIRPEKRPADSPVDAIAETFYPSLLFKRFPLSHLAAFSYPFMAFPSTSTEPIAAVPSLPIQLTQNESMNSISLNAPYVKYTDDNGEILDHLPVCQDYSRNMCTRINCKFVHLQEPKRYEIVDHKVSVCRDHIYGICKRSRCKFYHIPVQIPPKA